MIYKNLNSFSYEELKEIIQDQQHDLEYEKENVKQFQQESRILRKELYYFSSRVDKALEILSQKTQNPFITIHEAQKALTGGSSV